MSNRLEHILRDEKCRKQVEKSGITPNLDFKKLEDTLHPKTKTPKPSEGHLFGLIIPPPQIPINLNVSAQEEAIILLTTRPALLIRKNRMQIPSDIGIWAEPLSRNRMIIESRLPSIGRIEVDEGMGARHIGTGWMITDGVIATNRHVAEYFAIKQANGGVFKVSFQQRTYRAQIDFLEEHLENQQFEINVSEVIFMQDHDRQLPDVAFLKLQGGHALPNPIPLQLSEPIDSANIAVIGYPAFDPRYGLDALEAAKSVFGNIYDVKRLSPGRYLGDAGSWFFRHDATTLGGNSGSPVIDLTTGGVIGMHFSGEFRQANYAVKSSEILKLAEQYGVKPYQLTKPVNTIALPRIDATEERALKTDYANRDGFSETFLDSENIVSLPEIPESLTNEVLTFEAPDRSLQSVLNYTHFSVVMNQTRRLCFYSAVNIDGQKSQSIKGRRPTWKYDPRIGIEFQILHECYGLESESKFSRGHMTRREDPNWDSKEVATVANADTFHVTNACPQIQPYNAGIWLGLEDYALQNARQDDMRISVITGPIFQDSDPEIEGVKIPVRYWKIIAFIHDHTGKLSATGYIISQKNFLPGEEFVFGQFETYQVSLKTITTMTKLEFGSLIDKDPLKTTEEAIPVTLQDFSQIRWL